MGKTKLLFVLDSLHIGGAEKSLVTLLNHLDYNIFQVDLQLFKHGGAFERFLPTEVNVLPSIDFVFRSGVLSRILYVFSRICFSIRVRITKLLNMDKARIYWKLFSPFIPRSIKRYDIAIAYAQSQPSFYVIDKVSASRKILWINCEFYLKGKNLEFQRRFYNDSDRIVFVSDKARKVFVDIYPEFMDKFRVVLDLYDPDFILMMSKEPAEHKICHDDLVLLTVGRIEKYHKGSDLLMHTARILRDRGLKFRWYVVGGGPFEAEMKSYITDNNLQNVLIMLGPICNPYPYMSQCDIYVQTSRHEGFGLTVAEAKILNKPIVCTNFETSHMQLKNGFNGLIADFEPAEIADAIETLINDKSLYHYMECNLSLEKKGNLDMINDFYKLLS